MKKRKKRKRIRFKNLLLLLVILLIISGVIYLLANLHFKNIYVVNNSYLSDEAVLKELKIDKNSTVLLTNILTKKNDIDKSKMIKDVSFRYNIYLELYVDVTEYKVLFIDNNKAVLENGTKIDYKNEDLPVLINKIEDKKIYDSLVKRIIKVDDEVLSMISEISYVPNDIDKERFLFSMNDGNYAYVTLTKIKNINEYKNIIDSVENKKGILYLDYGNYFIPME